MKRSVGPMLLLAVCFLASGCLVRSLHPWLSDETAVADPSLIGAWHDAEEKTTLFLAKSASDGYDALLVLNGKDSSRYAASLHRIDGTLLLRVGPEDNGDLHSFALLPGYLLFKVVLDGDSLKLHDLDLDSFEKRAEPAAVGLVPGGSPTDGFILTADSGGLETFVRAQMAEPGFFDEDPLYSFNRLPPPPP